MTEIEEKVVQIISQVLANNDKGMIFELVSADENNRLPENEEVKGGMSDEYNAEEGKADKDEEAFGVKLGDDITDAMLSAGYAVQDFCNLVKYKIQ